MASNSDPGTYELIQKVQTLQNRLIQKTEEVVEKELMIQDKEKQYVELKVSSQGRMYACIMLIVFRLCLLASLVLKSLSSCPSTSRPLKTRIAK